MVSFGTLFGAFVCASRTHAQLKPLATLTLDCRALAISSTGLSACVAFHQMSFKKYTIERDDIWTVTLKGKRKRIVDGIKLVQTESPFSFAMRRLDFSPDGKLLTVQMTTAQDSEGTRQENKMIDLMDNEGREIPVVGTKTSVVLDAVQATWLADDQTVVYLLPSEESDLLYQIGLTKPKEGKGNPIFVGHLFTAVSWDPSRSSALAVERNKNFDEPIKLVRLDLIRETETPLADLPAYLGQLSVSPSGNKVAYFTDGETLEVRSLSHPQTAVKVHCVYGTFAWGRDENRILLKRGPEKNSGDLEWVSIPDGTLTPILHGLIFRSFAVSPDGHTIAVIEPGSNHLEVYPLE